MWVISSFDYHHLFLQQRYKKDGRIRKMDKRLHRNWKKLHRGFESTSAILVITNWFVLNSMPPHQQDLSILFRKGWPKQKFNILPRFWFFIKRFFRILPKPMLVPKSSVNYFWGKRIKCYVCMGNWWPPGHQPWSVCKNLRSILMCVVLL